ncbi:MAG: FapA family protein, partial [Vallitaleaceae bacterium]|nr:FapA family protein [Vallitaleaceae bacterium]
DSIEYHFKTEKDFRPEIDKDGNVNYHKLNVIANVSKGQLLATLTKGEAGRSGINILGMELKPKMPKPVKLKRGKNVSISSDQCQLFAEVDGLVKLEEGRVIVNDTYDVPNHVGSSTGDIEFHGSIIVHGNVMTGFNVKAQGDIEVMGVVEGANVEAGGNIILHRGVQGMSSCTVKAGGNLQARYIENADVIVNGTVHSEAILHSTVTARGEIIVEGKKGMISGGIVRSGIEIRSNILGSHMGTITNVEVGIDPVMWEEYNTLLKELPKLKQEALKLEQIIILLNKRKELEGQLDEQKQAMYVSATRNKIFISNKISTSEKRVEELKEDVEQRNDGRVIVRNIIYPGVRVTIGTAKYYVKDEVKYVKMVKDGADVRLSSL